MDGNERVTDGHAGLFFCGRVIEQLTGLSLDVISSSLQHVQKHDFSYYAVPCSLRLV